jgi:hypothetical protein
MAITEGVIDGLGWTPPSAKFILTEAVADMQVAGGGKFNLDATNLDTLKTPQGQIVQSRVADRLEKDAQIGKICSQLDPDTASGVFQDAIGKMYLLHRKPAAGTRVSVRYSGLQGATIPAGSLVQSTARVLYATNVVATIGIAGYVDVPCTCQVTGALPAAANTITKIYSAIPNVDSVNNPQAETLLGRKEETQQEFAARIRASTSANALGSVQAVIGNVSNLSGVSDVYALANFTPQTIVKGNIIIPSHYLYTAVVGGDDQDIFNALSRVVAGAAFVGKTKGYAQDASGANVFYAVAFQRPAPQIIYFKILMAWMPDLPANTISLVQSGILEGFNGLDGKPKAKIGSDIVGARFVGNINARLPTAEVMSIFVGLAVNPTQLRLEVPIDAVPITSEAYITVQWD